MCIVCPVSLPLHVRLLKLNIQLYHCRYLHYIKKKSHSPPGLMTVAELRQLEELPSPHNKFWVPCMWFVNLALRARTEGSINNDVALSAILNVRMTAASL